MRVNNIVIKPIVTEKSIADKDAYNRYYFKVNTKASKNSIKKAVEDLFDVEVVDVRTAVMPGKRKRMLKTYSFIKTKKWKKAMVQVKNGQKIKFVEESK